MVSGLIGNNYLEQNVLFRWCLKFTSSHLQLIFKCSVCLFVLRALFKLHWRAACGSRKQFCPLSGGHQIRPLLQSAPFMHSSPEVLTYKPNVHVKLEHTFVYGWAARHHRTVLPNQKAQGLSLPYISAWRSSFSSSTVAMASTVYF